MAVISDSDQLQRPIAVGARTARHLKQLSEEQLEKDGSTKTALHQTRAIDQQGHTG